MIRTLLTTTALAAALTTGALAQDQKLNEDTGMTPAAPELNATQPAPAGDPGGSRDERDAAGSGW